MNRLYRLYVILLLVSTLGTITKGIGQAPTIAGFFTNTGNGTQVVVIYGSNLYGVTGVSFGGKPATSFSYSEPQNIFAFPDTLGASGNIVITTTHGSVSQPGFVFTPLPIIHSFSPATAGEGTVVTINGSNLSNVAGVKFGEVSSSSSINIISANKITAQIGPGSSGAVSVITPIAITSKDGFVYTGPTINSFFPTSGPGGTIITITGNNFTAASSVEIGGIPVTSFNVLSPTTITAEVATGSSGYVTVTTPNGSFGKRGFNETTITSFSPRLGGPGDVIQITGYNFSGASAVSVGNDIAIPFTVSGDTSITATLTTACSYGYVKVTTPGTGKDSMNYFSFNSSPQALHSTPKIGGPGTMVHLTGKYFNRVTSVKIGGSPASSFQIVSDSVMDVVVGPGSSGYIELMFQFGSSSAQKFYYTTATAITSISPESGPVGTVISIKGSNFPANPSLNTVYIGAAKASVLSATPTTITAIVPTGATHGLVSLSAAGGVTFSPRPFEVTFPGDTTITTTSFASPINLSTTSPRGLCAVDFDGDNKPDLAIANVTGSNTGSVSIFRNTGSAGVISFASANIFTVTGKPDDIHSCDIDGDGKPDIIMTVRESIAILKNTSTAGNISFGAPYYTGIAGQSAGIYSVDIADLNWDGKPDLIASNYNDNRFFVMRNTSSSGTISFTNNSGYTALIYDRNKPGTVSTADINGDDVRDAILVYRASGGSHATLVELLPSAMLGPSTPYFGMWDIPDSADFNHVVVTDIDGDKKPEICLTSQSLNKIYIIKFSMSDQNVFSSSVTHEFEGGGALSKVCVGDLDGDGKPEFVTSNGSVFRNTSGNGMISFASPVNFQSGHRICLNDLDLDGKPEIILTDSVNNLVSILKNKIGLNLLQLCLNSPGPVIQSDVSGSTYHWQGDTGSGFNNISDNTNYSGTGSATLQLSAIPSSWSGYQYRCLVDGSNYSKVTEIRIRNFWTGVLNTDWFDPRNWSCGIIPDENTDVVISTGTIVLNASTTIRNLTLSSQVDFTVNPGVTLTITHP